MRKLTPNEAATAKETRRIRALVRRNAKRKGFESFDVQLGEDWTHDPAVYISFYLDPDYPTDNASIDALLQVKDRVKDALYKAGVDRIAYVKYRDREPATR